MLLLASVLVLAISRAELIARMKAPVITQADGMVRVYADCPEDMRREYQMPVARFAEDTVSSLNRLHKRKPERMPAPSIIIHLGEVRTNRSDVIVRAVTNGTQVATRITLPAPAYSDVRKLRAEVVRAYYRSIRREELSEAAALHAYRMSDPRLRIADERRELEDFVMKGEGDYEKGVRLMRKIIEPGKATRRDVLTFAARLYLYPPQYGQHFAGRYSQLSFREALDCVKIDPRIRVLAYVKAGEMPVFGGGRSPVLQRAAYAYMDYLLALAEGKCDEEQLRDYLEKAEGLLNQAYEQCSE